MSDHGFCRECLGISSYSLVCPSELVLGWSMKNYDVKGLILLTRATLKCSCFQKTNDPKHKTTQVTWRALKVTGSLLSHVFCSWPRGRLCGKGPTDLVVHSDLRVGITLVQSSHFAQVVANRQFDHLELHRHLLLQRREVQLAAKESVWVIRVVPFSSYPTRKPWKRGQAFHSPFCIALLR